MSKKNIFKIIIPLAIIAVVVGIWIFANQQEQALVEEENKIAETVSDENFLLNADSIDLDTLKSYELPMIIDFGADSCVPCKEMAPVLVKVNEEMQNKAIIKFVDVWKNPDAATNYPVQVIPTQVFFNADGTPYMPSEDIPIEFSMYSDNETNEHVYTTHQGALTEEQMNLILEDMGVE